MFKWTKDWECEYLAPTTCTSTEVPCIEHSVWTLHSDGRYYSDQKEEGNNPMFAHECVAYDQSQSLKPKNASGAGAVASVVLSAAPDTEQGQRKYLESRARDVMYIKRDEIIKIFFIEEPEGPKTAKELKQRLAKGLYTVAIPKDIDDDEDEDFGYFHWRDAFSWRTPDTQPDRKGK